MTIRPRKSLLNPDLVRPRAINEISRDLDLIWLDKNENFDRELLLISNQVLQTIDKLSIASYPEAGKLYVRLAVWAGVSPDACLLTPGSDGAIRMIFEAFVEHGDSVIHTSPTFAMYPVYCKIFGANEIQIDYILGRNGPELPIELLLENLKLHKPKLLCIPNPDSPTGTVLAPEILHEILLVCEEVGTVLLIDEAYYPFYEWSAVEWTKKSRNLIVARTFAKAWAAAGMRIGYAIAHPETIKLLHKLRPMYEVGTIPINFIYEMFNYISEIEMSVTRINEGKKFFVERLRLLGFDVHSTHGNFVHVNFGELSGVIHRALENKVLYRLDFDHISLKGFSRFTVGPIDVMKKVIGYITEVVENYNEI